MRRRGNADLDRFYWLLVDVPRRWADVEVEQSENRHESVFDAIDACMNRERRVVIESQFAPPTEMKE